MEPKNAHDRIVPGPAPATVPACASCPLWSQRPDRVSGMCRLKPPQTVVVGMGEGMDRAPRPVTTQVYAITRAEDACAAHPQLLQSLIVRMGAAFREGWDGKLTWSRESGFSRAPTLQEARAFTPDPAKGREDVVVAHGTVPVRYSDPAKRGDS